MEQKKNDLEIGDLAYLTCDTTRKCLMTIASVSETTVSLIFVDKNNVPQSIVDLHKNCIKKLHVG